MKVARRALFGIPVLGLAFAASPLMAQQQMPHDLDEDEYYLYSDTNPKQVVDYRNDRVMRICTGQSPHMISLTVIADEREIEVAPGDCVRVEAKQVSLQPTEDLPDLAMIKVGVLTIDY